MGAVAERGELVAALEAAPAGSADVSAGIGCPVAERWELVGENSSKKRRCFLM